IPGACEEVSLRVHTFRAGREITLWKGGQLVQMPARRNVSCTSGIVFIWQLGEEDLEGDSPVFGHGLLSELVAQGEEMAGGAARFIRSGPQFSSFPATGENYHSQARGITPTRLKSNTKALGDREEAWGDLEEE
ncbi:hypothetical protein BaRGS_00035305, partial [Batillaria attramentaria]